MEELESKQKKIESQLEKANLRIIKVNNWKRVLMARLNNIKWKIDYLKERK